MNNLICPHQDVCSGCPAIKMPYEEQLKHKRQGLLESCQSQAVSLPQVDIFPVRPFHIRDKVDLTLKNINGVMTIGFYGKDTRDVVDIKECPQMSENLFKWFSEFRSRLPNIKIGSVRLRVSTEGLRGVWLDFANLDIKNLFEEKTYLRWLSQKAFVEIGQRRKKLVFINEQPKLIDPEPQRWFGHYGLVGGFSQVGHEANAILKEKVVEFALHSGLKRWTEIFCGSGNFSLALAQKNFSVLAVDNDELALHCLKKTISEDGITSIETLLADAYRAEKLGQIPMSQGLLLDPPRSGIKDLPFYLAKLPEVDRPRAIIYVSCFTESFVNDLKNLNELGFRVEKIIGIDQFPQSEHCEWISLLTR